MPASLMWENPATLQNDNLPFCLQPPAQLVVNHLRRRHQGDSFSSSSSATTTAGHEEQAALFVRLKRSVTNLCRALLANNVSTQAIETILLGTLCQLSRLETLLDDTNNNNNNNKQPDESSSSLLIIRQDGEKKSCEPSVNDFSQDNDTVNQCGPSLSTLDHNCNKYGLSDAPPFGGSSPTASTKSCKSGASTRLGSPVSCPYSPTLSSHRSTPSASVITTSPNRIHSPSSYLDTPKGESETTAAEFEWLERISDPAWRLSLAFYMACAWLEEDIISAGSLLSAFLRNDMWFTNLATKKSFRGSSLCSKHCSTGEITKDAHTDKPVGNSSSQDACRRSLSLRHTSPPSNVPVVSDMIRTADCPSHLELRRTIVALFDSDLLRTMEKLDFRLRVDINDILSHGVSLRLRNGCDPSEGEWHYTQCDNKPVVKHPSQGECHYPNCDKPVVKQRNRVPCAKYCSPQPTDPRRLWDLDINIAEEDRQSWSPTSPNVMFDGYDCDPLDAI